MIHFKSTTDNWRTPHSFYKKLNEEFNFNFDPCPLNESPEFDGLSIEWGTRTFCNPPYSELGKWIEKAFIESRKNKLIVMLIPSRTDTKAWHKFVMKADEIRFIEGRLKFGDAKNNAPFPSAVIIFNQPRTESK